MLVKTIVNKLVVCIISFILSIQISAVSRVNYQNLKTPGLNQYPHEIQ
jgi:hypothetical protein